MTTRPNAAELLELCRDGVLEPIAVLEDVLFNYMSADDAEDFARTEYLND